MIDINFIEQIIQSLENAVQKLEEAKIQGNSAKENQLKIFILDLSQKLNLMIPAN